MTGRGSLRQEPLFLLDAAAVGDVDEDADRAANAAVAVEQGRGVFNQRHPAAIGPEHVDDDAVDLAAFDRRQAHRPCFGRERLAVFRHREGGVIDSRVLRRREGAVLQPDEFGEGAVEADVRHAGSSAMLMPTGSMSKMVSISAARCCRSTTEFAYELDRLRGHRWGPGVSACYTRRRTSGERRSGPSLRGRMGCARGDPPGVLSAWESPSPKTSGCAPAAGAVW